MDDLHPNQLRRIASTAKDILRDIRRVVPAVARGGGWNRPKVHAFFRAYVTRDPHHGYICMAIAAFRMSYELQFPPLGRDDVVFSHGECAMLDRPLYMMCNEDVPTLRELVSIIHDGTDMSPFRWMKRAYDVTMSAAARFHTCATHVDLMDAVLTISNCCPMPAVLYLLGRTLQTMILLRAGPPPPAPPLAPPPAPQHKRTMEEDAQGDRHLRARR